MTSTVQSLMEAGTAVISDVFDKMGYVPPVLDNSLVAIPGPGVRFAGPAYTITGESHSWSGKGDRAKLAAIDAMAPGVVPVWAGNDIRGVCCFGDLLAEAMKARGCAGVVVDGGVRDLAYLKSLELPMMVRYRTPAQAIGRWRVSDSQVPIRLRGALEDWVEVKPGDTVVADDDGVIILPVELVNKIETQVMAWAEKDSRAREDIRHGTPLLEALDKYGHL
ncbi:MAG: RraA family protein [Deltaproteobacteria bacterium]|nr:MAG: RraA family protein [Deltaproteobacteria bacterium]